MLSIALSVSATEAVRGLSKNKACFAFSDLAETTGAKDLRHLVNQLPVVFTVPGFVLAKLLIKIELTKIRQQSDSPTEQSLALFVDK